MNPLEELNSGIPHLLESLRSQEVFSIGPIPVTTFTIWTIILFVLVLCVVLLASKRAELIPNSKFAHMVEYGYDFVRGDIGESAIGHGYEKHIPFLATMFFFILISNFVGLIPGCKTPTGTISNTWALAIVSFIYFNYYGIKTKGGLGYLKSLAPSGLPKPMVPVIWFFEFISMVLRALTLAVRLYGNMFAGHMVLGIFALATSIFIQTGIGAIKVASVGWFALLLVMYALEILVAFLQAYVFTILSAVYISLATEAH